MKKTFSQIGRTLLETLAVLVIMTVISTGAILMYTVVVDKVQMRNLARMVMSLVKERQHLNFDESKEHSRTVKGPHGMEIKIKTPLASDSDGEYFSIEFEIEDEDLCVELTKSGLIEYQKLKINNSLEGLCPGIMTFYFYKNLHQDASGSKDDSGEAPCPPNAICENGNSVPSNCVEGYFLNEGVCIECPQNSINCLVGGFECQVGFYKSGNFCINCPTTGVDECVSGGFTCMAGYYKQMDGCFPCEDNYISEGGLVTECIPCEKGKTSKDHIECISENFCGNHGDFYQDLGDIPEASNWGFSSESGCVCEKGWGNKIDILWETDPSESSLYLSKITESDLCTVPKEQVCGGYGRMITSTSNLGTRDGDSFWAEDFDEKEKYESELLANGAPVCLCDEGCGYYTDLNGYSYQDRCVPCVNRNTEDSYCTDCLDGYGEYNGECLPICTDSCPAGQYCHNSGGYNVCIVVEKVNTYTDKLGGRWHTFKLNWFPEDKTVENITSVCESQGMITPTFNYFMAENGRYPGIFNYSQDPRYIFPGGEVRGGVVTYMQTKGTTESICKENDDIKFCTGNLDCPDNRFCALYKNAGYCLPIGEIREYPYNGKRYLVSEAKTYFSTGKVVSQWCSRVRGIAVSATDFIPGNLIDANLENYTDRFISWVEFSQDFPSTTELQNLFSSQKQADVYTVRCYSNGCYVEVFKDLNPYNAGIGDISAICQIN